LFILISKLLHTQLVAWGPLHPRSLNEIRTTKNILNVLPATVITSLPNANVADAVGRLPSFTLSVTRVKASMSRSAVLGAALSA